MKFKLGKKFAAWRQRLKNRATRGSAAIEFAMVAPVFFTMLFAILETGIMYFSQFTLQNAVTVAARQIRTGQAQQMNLASTAKCDGTAGTYANTQAWFKGQVCCGISQLLTDCTNLHVNVQNYAGGFSGTGFSNSKTNGLYTPVADNYSPGNACDVVLVQATYTWTVYTPVLSYFLVNMAGNAHLLSSTTAFRNEPYTTAIGGC